MIVVVLLVSTSKHANVVPRYALHCTVYIPAFIVLEMNSLRLNEALTIHEFAFGVAIVFDDCLHIAASLRRTLNHSAKHASVVGTASTWDVLADLH
jgi:uncharacterized membrane protein YecN with MAPEG domain